jgi:hypothetical protein
MDWATGTRGGRATGTRGGRATGRRGALVGIRGCEGAVAAFKARCGQRRKGALLVGRGRRAGWVGSGRGGFTSDDINTWRGELRMERNREGTCSGYQKHSYLWSSRISSIIGTFFFLS